MAKKIYSYVLRYDDGAAPNPFWEVCTLTICKPMIRRKAEIGDWVIGTGSANTQLARGEKVNFSEHLVYAMKVTDKMSMEAYEKHCRNALPNKIPVWNDNDWRLRMGDCIYHDFLTGLQPKLRRSVHNESNRDRDLSGLYALLSNEFYYFGSKPEALECELKGLIKCNQGHRVIQQATLIEEFEKWIKRFTKNTLYASPQLRWQFEGETDNEAVAECARQRCRDDEDEAFEVLC